MAASGREASRPRKNSRGARLATEVRVRLLIAVPVFNEQKYVGRVLDKVKGFHSDVLVVDDGSTDESFSILARLQAGDAHLRIIRFRRNFGKTAALSAAFANVFPWLCGQLGLADHRPVTRPAVAWRQGYQQSARR